MLAVKKLTTNGRIQVTRFQPGVSSRIGARYAIRANRELRLLFDREGDIYVLKDFVRRNNRLVYKRER